jgi:hypothetical protein
VYRDDPLDDEDELRAVIGDEAVDRIQDAPIDPAAAVGAAVDALRILQGWVSDQQAAAWFRQEQRRLEDRSPIAALAAGLTDEVLDAARRWAAAQG